MTSSETFTKEIIGGYRKTKGKAYVYAIKPLDPSDAIVTLVYNFCNKFVNSTVLIVTDDYNTRTTLSTRIKNEVGENKATVLTETYININRHYSNPFVILVGITNIKIIRKFAINNLFCINFFKECILDNDLINCVNEVMTPIMTSVNNVSARKDLIYSPVEETQIGVSLPDDIRKEYDKHTEFINTSLSIFGDLNNISKCRIGDDRLGISAAEFRSQLAEENGWSPTLDVSVQFNKDIDEVYNPNSLYERAVTFYNITALRRNILTDNENKISAILEIINNNPNKKILIVSKRGEFAAKITKAINNDDNCNAVCGDYHDAIEDQILLDDYGIPITYKTGVNKGKPRIVKSQAISGANLRKFQEGRINCLSIKFSSNTKLNIACDIVIMTSAINDNIIEIKERFTNITYNTNPTQVYLIYSADTVEEQKMLQRELPPNVMVINENKNNLIYDEKSGNIIL